MNIEYVGSVLDSSGYSSAIRRCIIALKRFGHNISIAPISFGGRRIDLVAEENEIIELMNKPITPEVRILQMTPELMVQYCNKDAVPTVGYFDWETDELPYEWKKDLEKVKNIISPCERQARVINNQVNGANVLGVVGHATDTDMFDVKNKNKDLDKFVFYSIFQWSERKNPVGLLRAYWSEFKGHNDVKLVIKTYGCPGVTDDKIKKEVEFIMIQFPLTCFNRKASDYPELQIITGVLSYNFIRDLHANGDCYVSLHRGEGFGLPIIEAMASGRAPIATNYYACEDYLTEENSYRVGYSLEPVHNMCWSPWYTGNQLWADPDINQAKKCMRVAYENRDETIKKGLQARKDVISKYSIEAIGKQYTDVLEKFLGEKR